MCVRIRKISLFIISIFMMISLFTICSEKVNAEVKQATIVDLDERQDLVVLFNFDREVVDITFISPSGQKMTADSASVDYEEGDLWSSYRIADASAGAWKVEYDLGKNSEINYSIVNQNYGLWIQYFEPDKTSEDEITAYFEADYEGDDVYYRYEIYAVSTTDEENAVLLYDGGAYANEEVTTDIDLSKLTSDEYIFKLEVYYDDNGVELFDTVVTDSFSYTNNNEPDALEDFKITVDPDKLDLTVDWNDYAHGNDGYKLVVEADGDIVYSNKLERSITVDSVAFSEGTKELKVSLYYRYYDIWSKPKTKTVNLSEEYIACDPDDVLGTSQFVLSYKFNKQRVVLVKLNEDEGEYQLKEEGTLAFDVTDGSNTINVSTELDDNVFFVIDKDIYYDITPPTIDLFEDLDGKIIASDNVTIIGKISGGTILRVSGETIAVGEDGSFTYTKQLVSGENTVDMEAEDANGNVTLRTLTLYKDVAAEDVAAESVPGPLDYLPLYISLGISLIIIVLSIIFMKKKRKDETGKKGNLVSWIICDIVLGIAGVICLWQFIVRYIDNTGEKFLEIAERSASEAAKLLRIEKLYGIATIVCFGLLILSFVVTTFISIRAKKKAKAETNINNNQTPPTNGQ